MVVVCVVCSCLRCVCSQTCPVVQISRLLLDEEDDEEEEEDDDDEDDEDEDGDEDMS